MKVKTNQNNTTTKHLKTNKIMTLKEKFENNITETQGNIKIAEDFAIGFAEWFTNEKSKYSVMYGKQEKRFATFTKEYTAKELLEIYKKEKGL
jgi:hypothetical protein